MKLNKKKMKTLLKRFGTLYSKELGINLDSGKEREIFKWFLASMLYGARISETCARNTYKVFEKKDVLTPDKILEKGMFGLIPMMGEGGYTRYDGKTSDMLLKVMKKLKREYKGSLKKLHDYAADPKDLEERLMGFHGIGSITVNILLRELRGVWRKADPKPAPLVRLAMRYFGIKDLKEFWKKNKIRGYDIRNFECALLRVGKDYIRKKEKFNL